jgi:hypothetical protein
MFSFSRMKKRAPRRDYRQVCPGAKTRPFRRDGVTWMMTTMIGYSHGIGPPARRPAPQS